MKINQQPPSCLPEGVSNTQRILDLCSGIGGFSLGAILSGGFETVAFCEIDQYCQQVLSLRFPGTPIIEDIRDVSAQSIPAVDGIIAGFPCQPHSHAGQQKASQDQRDLWPEIRRILREIQPRWTVLENVPGLLSSESGKFFGRILRDLAALGFDAEWGIVSCAEVGGVHRRERIWIIAYAQSARRNPLGNQHAPARANTASGCRSANAANPKSEGLARRNPCTAERSPVARPQRRTISIAQRKQILEPALCGSNDGLPAVLDGYLLRPAELAEWLGAATVPSFPRLSASEVASLAPADRQEYRLLWAEYQAIRRQHKAELAALGNAIVPQVAKQVFDRLKVGLAQRQSATQTLVAYIDEVGYGTCFGPPVVCALLLRSGCHARLAAAGVTDSKQLFPARRQQLLALINECAIAIRYGYATVAEVNSLNIKQATFLAMRRAIAKLPHTPELILVDGAHQIPGVTIPQKAVTSGDAKEVGIAAASILAKEWRDALLVRLARRYPDYGLERHKGYCTPAHREAIQRLGVTRLHHTNNKWTQRATNG